MTEATKPTEPKKLADMNASELNDLIAREEAEHRLRQKRLKALAAALETEPNDK